MIGLTDLALMTLLTVSPQNDSLLTERDKYIQEHYVEEKTPSPHLIMVDGPGNKCEGELLLGNIGLKDSAGVDTAYVIIKGILKKQVCKDTLQDSVWNQWYIETNKNFSPDEKEVLEFMTRMKTGTDLPIYFDPKMIK